MYAIVSPDITLAFPGLGRQGTEVLWGVEVWVLHGVRGGPVASAGRQTVILRQEVVLVTPAAGPAELNAGVPGETVVVPGEGRAIVTRVLHLQAVGPASGLLVGLHHKSGKAGAWGSH